MHREYLIGLHSVTEALRAGRRRIDAVWATEARAREVQRVVPSGVRVQTITPADLLQRCRGAGVEGGSGDHQGLLAQVGPYPYVAPEALLKDARRDPAGPWLLVLDQIQDPHNLGAIIRTAHGCGVHGVIIPKDRSALVTPTVSRTSAGAVEHQPVACVTNLAQTLAWLRTEGIWTVGAAAEGPTAVYDYDFTAGQAIVMGSEGEGLRRLVREHCDTLVHLPLHGRVDSYNVSVAAAMILGEALRQRSTRPSPAL